MREVLMVGGGVRATVLGSAAVCSCPAQSESEMDEVEFRQALRARDTSAWTELYRLHSRQLARQARLILPPQIDPDDAVSEVWLRGYRSARGYDPSRPPYPWLARICLHVCLTARKKRRTVPYPTELEPAARTGHTERAYHASRAALRTAIEHLSRRPREVLSLRFLFNLSTEEIGAILGMKVNSVHQTLVRGMTQLRRGGTVPTLDQELQFMRSEDSA